MSGTERKYVGLNPLPPDFARSHPPLAVVVEENCIGCDRCISLCFFNALEMIDKSKYKYKRVAFVDSDNCTGCGLCFEACPTDAFIWVPDQTNGCPFPKGESNMESRILKIVDLTHPITDSIPIYFPWHPGDYNRTDCQLF